MISKSERLLDLRNLNIAAEKIRSKAPNDVFFRKTYGVDLLRSQVKDQASDLWGKLADHGIPTPSLPAFILVFTHGIDGDRLILSNSLTEKINQLS